MACDMLAPATRNILFSTIARCSNFLQPVCHEANGTATLVLKQVEGKSMHAVQPRPLSCTHARPAPLEPWYLF